MAYILKNKLYISHYFIIFMFKWFIIMSIYLNENLNILLTESIAQSLVYDAIQNHNVVEINYDGDENIAKGKRIIEPYVLGRSSKNNIVIRAFQPNGDTQTSVPNWKMFRVDKISYWKPTKKTFNNTPQERGFNVEPYNENGDNNIRSIRIQVHFNKNDNNVLNNQISKNIDKNQNKQDIDRHNLIKQTNNDKIKNNQIIQKQKDSINQQNNINLNKQDFYNKNQNNNNDIKSQQDKLEQTLNNNDYSNLQVSKDELRRNLADYNKNKQKFNKLK